MAGPGIMYYPNGDKYVGNFENDKLHGTGVIYVKKTQTKR